MKNALVLVIALFGLAAGCDPSLGEALDDVEAGAPGVCRDVCNPRTECEWQNLDGVTGPESEALLNDLKTQCVIECAYRAENGVFVYEQDWDENAQANVYTVKEVLDGGIWVDYLECLVDSALWVCEDTNPNPEHENWAYAVDTGTPEDCTAYEACVALLGINLEYEWNPNANEGEGACHPDGDEHLWGAW
jgi:hypothetical protein